MKQCLQKTVKFKTFPQLVLYIFSFNWQIKLQREHSKLLKHYGQDCEYFQSFILARLHRNVWLRLPEKILLRLPEKNKYHAVAFFILKVFEYRKLDVSNKSLLQIYLKIHFSYINTCFWSRSSSNLNVTLGNKWIKR